MKSVWTAIGAVIDSSKDGRARSAWMLGYPLDHDDTITRFEPSDSHVHAAREIARLADGCIATNARTAGAVDRIRSFHERRTPDAAHFLADQLCLALLRRCDTCIRQIDALRKQAASAAHAAELARWCQRQQQRITESATRVIDELRHAADPTADRAHAAIPVSTDTPPQKLA